MFQNGKTQLPKDYSFSTRRRHTYKNPVSDQHRNQDWLFQCRVSMALPQTKAKELPPRHTLKFSNIHIVIVYIFHDYSYFFLFLQDPSVQVPRQTWHSQSLSGFCICIKEFQQKRLRLQFYLQVLSDIFPKQLCHPQLSLRLFSFLKACVLALSVQRNWSLRSWLLSFATGFPQSACCHGWRL